MTYREYIYNRCIETDISNEDDVLELLQLLAYESTLYHDLLMIYENKLKEIMSFKDFDKFATDTAKELFKADIGGLEESEFKDFILENFEDIVEGDDNDL